MRMGAFGGGVRKVPTPAGPFNYPAPAPEGGCVIGAGARNAAAGPNDLYALGQRCPAQGWLNRQGSQPSWQPLPSR
jgi:hypothetical protein